MRHISVLTRLSLCVLVLVALRVDTTPAAQAERFTLAVVWEPNGVLRPFATFDGRTWRQAWPGPDEFTQPGAIDDIPSVWRSRGERVPRAWHAWPLTGGPAVRLQIMTAQVDDSGCFKQVALGTDLPKAGPSQSSRFGVAVDSSGVAVTAIEEVPPTNAAFTAAEKTVLSSFPLLERATSNQRVIESAQAAARLTRLYRDTQSPRSPMYFVAERLYGNPFDPRDPQCMAALVVTGWLVPAANGGYRVTATRAYATDCDREAVRIARPLGALRIGKRSFWALSEAGYEDVQFQIAEIQPSEVTYRLTVDGGGC